MQEIQGIEFSEFLNVLQAAGEEADLMDVNDERQDRWVPLPVIEKLLRASVAGMSKVMLEIFPIDERTIF